MAGWWVTGSFPGLEGTVSGTGGGGGLDGLQNRCTGWSGEVRICLPASQSEIRQR